MVFKAISSFVVKKGRSKKRKKERNRKERKGRKRKGKKEQKRKDSSSSKALGLGFIVFKGISNFFIKKGNNRQRKEKPVLLWFLSFIFKGRRKKRWRKRKKVKKREMRQICKKKQNEKWKSREKTKERIKKTKKRKNVLPNFEGPEETRGVEVSEGAPGLAEKWKELGGELRDIFFPASAMVTYFKN